MNIFAIHNSPTTSARALCDRHVVKMILESVQMLSFATDNWRGASTHYNHPCSRWTRRTLGNYRWLHAHTRELLREYTRRYGKTHAWSTEVPLMRDVRGIPRHATLTTPFVQCMPEQYKHRNPVHAYRQFYIHEKSSFAQWRHSQPPSWYPKELLL